MYDLEFCQPQGRNVLNLIARIAQFKLGSDSSMVRAGNVKLMGSTSAGSSPGSARIFVLGHGVKIKKNIFCLIRVDSQPCRFPGGRRSALGFVWLICHMIPLGVDLEFSGQPSDESKIRLEVQLRKLWSVWPAVSTSAQEISS